MQVALTPPVMMVPSVRGGSAKVVSMPDLEPSDSELIGRIADGDRAAFNVLYRRYARPVFGLALRLQLPRRAWRRSAVALHRGAERDRRQVPCAGARGRSCPSGPRRRSRA